MQNDKMVTSVAGKFFVVLLSLHLSHCDGRNFAAGPSHESPFYIPESSNRSVGRVVTLSGLIASTLKLQQDPYNRATVDFAKRVLDTISQRTSFANTKEEVSKAWADATAERDDGQIKKRTEGNEQHVGGCTASKVWISLGSNHFPRFLKNYNCTSSTCDHNFGECRPKLYSVKVLRRKTSESSSITEEDCDPNLPQELRCGWNLVPVTITTYCECVSSRLIF